MARTKRVSSHSEESPSPPKLPKVHKVDTAEATSQHPRFGLSYRTPEPTNGADNYALPGTFHSSPPVIQYNAGHYTTPSTRQQHDAPGPSATDEDSSRTTYGGLRNGVTVHEAFQAHNGSGVELLGREVKKLITAANKLRDLGIEKFDLKLPKICVVGDQSTGKSSLIEGISAIKVPRGEDACTRCPLELILQDSHGPWKCILTIVIKYKYTSGATNLEVSPLGPWSGKDTPELHHFVEIEDKSELPMWLRRAQLAILNPLDDLQNYRDRDIPQEVPQVPFSPNFIRLDISGPGTPNLSFYDLPGVIVQDRQQYVPQLIQRLVCEYVSAPNSLVLYTLPMNNDVANSNAGAIVKEMKADNRTLGVITKPDTLVRSNLTQWKRILEGVAFPLGLGYFVVKNEPDSEVSHSVARQRESEFFMSDPTFSLTLAGFQERFGTTKLQDYLSRKLTLQIKEQLPEIRYKIDERAKMIDEELRFLPKPPPEDMIRTIQARSIEFGRQVCLQMEGSSSKDDFFNVWRSKAEDMRNSLVQSFPDVQLGSKSASTVFAPRTPVKHPSSRPSATQKTDFSVDPIALSSDEEETPSKRKEASPTQPGTPKQRSQATTQEKTVKEEILQKNRDAAKSFSLSNIKSRISAATRGFPGAFDPKVIAVMYGESTMHWQHVFTEFMDFTKAIVDDIINQAYGNAFGVFHHTSLFDKIHSIVRLSVTDAVTRHQGTLENLLRLELGRPLTINDADFVARKEILDKEIVERRRRAWTNKLLGDMMTERGGRITQEDKKTAETEAETRISAIPYKLEISAMASTRAYYECVAKRFADFCHTIIVKGLFEELSNDLPDAVCTKLEFTKNGANDRLRHMAEVSREVANKRAQCEKDLDALKNAKAYLEELLTNGTTHEGPHEQVPRSGTLMPEKMEE